MIRIWVVNTTTTAAEKIDLTTNNHADKEQFSLTGRLTIGMIWWPTVFLYISVSSTLFVQ
jgi:hypothetical protein